MKKIITSALLASAVFCMAAPANNNTGKHGHNTIAVSNNQQYKGENPQPKDNAKPKAKETTASKVKKDKEWSIWNNDNGGGRTTYH